MTGDCRPRFDDTIMLASDTFTKNPRQKKIQFDFFVQSSSFMMMRPPFARQPRKQCTRAMIQK
jgi:hypothetical protein